MLLGDAPVSLAEGVGSGSPEPESEPEVDGEGEPPCDCVGAGAGGPMSVPDGKAGVVWAPATICTLVPARFETGPPGKV